MLLARRILLFPLVRALIVLVLIGLFATPPVLLLRALELLGKSAVLLELVMAAAALLALGLVTRFIERRPFFETLLPARGAARDVGLGFGLGVVLIAGTFGALALAGYYRITGFDAQSFTAGCLAMLRATGLFFLVAVFEETLFRGVIYRLSEEGLGTWIALALSAALFGLMHLSAPGANLGAAIAVALEAGVLLGALYLVRRTLWLPIGTHWAWNLFEGPVFGTNVSGQHETGLFRSVTTGPALWTGGKFGPEAGLVSVILCTLAGGAVLLIAARRGRTLAPFWRRTGAAPVAAGPSTTAEPPLEGSSGSQAQGR
jgi:hypothetical protein